MRTSTLERTQRVASPIDDAFAFFADPLNLAEITPAWLHFRILEAPARLERGALIRYRLRVKGVPIRWVTEIVDWQPPRSFIDMQRAGPYRLWEHTHRLIPVAEGTEIRDLVRYLVPGGPLARLVDAFVRPLLDEIFDYRELQLARLLGPPRRAWRHGPEGGDPEPLPPGWVSNGKDEARRAR